MIILTTLVCVVGCYRRVPVRQPEERWWEKGKVWVKTEGYSDWIEVTRVQSDSVYGKTRLNVLDESLQDVIVPLETVERIEREKKSLILTAFGLTFGLSVVFLYCYVSSLSELN